MSTDKENVKPKTKIPVLKDKSLPRCAFGKNESPNADIKRNPLRTIENENVDQNCVPGPSRDIPVPRYVTYRNNNKELDWNFDVFGGRSNKPHKDVPLEQIVSGNSVTNAVTPGSLSQSVTKKVKRSLKRPHSIVTQAIAPIATGTPLSPTLLHLETKSASLNYPLQLQNLYDDPLCGHYALDNLQYLLKTENKMTERPGIRTASRACVINWIVKVHISSGNPAVIQQTCCYLDKYLSSSLVTAPRIQVITAACFWIATKFYGGFVSGQRLVKYSGNAFVVNELVATERNILRKLNFQVHTVVPQDFIPYLSWWCGRAYCADVEVAATFLCLCGLMVDKTLNRQYPSVIAAAAVKISLVLLHKTICMDQLQACPIYKAAEKKSSNLSKTCDQLYAAIRVIRSPGYEYKALIEKYAGPPSFIISKIFEDF